MPPEILHDQPDQAPAEMPPLSPWGQQLLRAREVTGVATSKCFSLQPIYTRPRLTIAEYFSYIAERQFPYQVYGKMGTHDKRFHTITAIKLHPCLVNLAVTGATDGLYFLERGYKERATGVSGTIDRYISDVGAGGANEQCSASIRRLMEWTTRSRQYSASELAAFCDELAVTQQTHNARLYSIAATLS